MTVTKQFLSGTPGNGRQIKIAATATPGTTIHTADPTAKDEVFIWVTNEDTVDRQVTIEFGGTTAPDDNIKMTIPTQSGPVLVVPGIPLSNSLVVKAFAAVANQLVVSGYVNRIS